VQVATGVGLALGQGISGFVGSTVGWRVPFVIVSVPAIALATLMLFTTEEPVRGSTEAALQQQWDSDADFEYSERITWKKVGRLVRIPTNILVISQGLPGCLPWGMLLTFLNDYLAQDKGLKVTSATTVVLAIGIGGGVGVIGGGIIGQKLYNTEKWTMPVFIGICTVIGTVPMWFIVNADVVSMLGTTFFMAVLTGIMSSTVGPNMRAMMMNVNEPETRGVALALQTMLDDLGKGLGPALVAVLISSVGRTAAFNISTAGWIPCGLLLLSASMTLAKDEAAMQHRLKASISRMSLASSASRAASAVELADFQRQQQAEVDHHYDVDLELPSVSRDGPLLRPTTKY
jgi:predicted MFS family arabinose efflux permease